MKNKKMSAASNSPNKQQVSEKGSGSKQSSTSTDQSQTKKTQPTSSQEGAAVKSKNTK